MSVHYRICHSCGTKLKSILKAKKGDLVKIKYNEHSDLCKKYEDEIVKIIEAHPFPDGFIPEAKYVVVIEGMLWRLHDNYFDIYKKGGKK